MKQSQLEICDICGHELSVHAEVCPHCGDPKHRGNQFVGCVWWMLKMSLALLVLWAMLSLFL